jgi:hypothetical protein
LLIISQVTDICLGKMLSKGAPFLLFSLNFHLIFCLKILRIQVDDWWPKTYVCLMYLKKFQFWTYDFSSFVISLPGCLNVNAISQNVDASNLYIQIRNYYFEDCYVISVPSLDFCIRDYFIQDFYVVPKNIGCNKHIFCQCWIENKFHKIDTRRAKWTQVGELCQFVVIFWSSFCWLLEW